MHLRLIAALVLLLATSCAVGKPPLFSDGGSWSFPVVSDEGALLTPVYIGDKGPYLFAIMPGLESAIDPSVVEELDLFNMISGRALVSAEDVRTAEQVRLAEVTGFRVGDLELRTHRLAIIKTRGTYNGIPVRGVLGSSVFDDTVAWTIDRDRRMVYLTVQEQFTAPTEAPIGVRVRDDAMFVRPTADGTDVELRVDIMQPATLLFPWTVDKAGLSSRGGDVYTVRELEFANGLMHSNLSVVRFHDKRVRPNTLDGRLGSDFFSNYRVTVNMHTRNIWLEDRPGLRATVDDRLARWGNALPGCAQGECGSARAVSVDGGHMIEVMRDAASAGADAELIFAAYDGEVEAISLPRLQVSMPRGATSVRVRTSQAEAYLDKELRLVDASPFAVNCGLGPETGCAQLVQ